MTRLRNFLFLLGRAVRAGAFLDFFEFLIYRSPLGRRWAKVRGLRFHRSTLLWFTEGPSAHTRIIILLPRYQRYFRNLETVDLEFEFYEIFGRLLQKTSFAGVSVRKPFVFDSRRPPEGLGIPKSFEGSLLVKLRFNAPEEEVFKRQGLFGTTHTYIDYYREGAFVTTLHDYCAYLPDQGIQYASLGMIPAYCDGERETFLVMHAAGPGRGRHDQEALLYGPDGRWMRKRLPSLKPFAVQKVMLSELFLEAETFLRGGVGQVVVKGIFRATLKRTAYGIFNKKDRTFSLDHCYYSIFEKPPPMPAAHREGMPKGWFNPFFVMEDEGVSTSAVIFHVEEEKKPKEIDVLVYDADGRFVAQVVPFACVSGNEVLPIRIGEILRKNGVSLPFIGHAEVLYHLNHASPAYDRDLDIYVEYNRRGKPATVIFGSDPWNAPKAVQNRSYQSGFRVVCDEIQTTRVAISNCSYDYNYRLAVPFTLTLTVDGTPLAARRMEIGPNATIFKSIEELFPDAVKLLAENQGVGVLATSDINCSCLTQLFVTEDRRSGAWSVEHSLDV